MTNTTYTFSQETINAMTELGATNKKCTICNHGNSYIMRGVVTYADGHKERITANGKLQKQPKNLSYAELLSAQFRPICSVRLAKNMESNRK